MPRSANTEIEFTRDVSLEDAERHVQAIADAWIASKAHGVCFLNGKGAQQRALYQDVARVSGATILYLQSLIPWPAAPLRLLIASYESVLEITDPKTLSTAFWRVVERSMAGIFFVNNERAHTVRELLRNARDIPVDLWSTADPTYAFYMLDADNAESATGFHEIVSLGAAAPDYMRQTIRAIQAP